MVTIDYNKQTLKISITGTPLASDLTIISNYQVDTIKQEGIKALEIDIHSSSSLGAPLYESLCRFASCEEISEIVFRSSSSPEFFRELYYTRFFYDHIYLNKHNKTITWFHDNSIISGKKGYQRALRLVRKNAIYCARNTNRISIGTHYRDEGWRDHFTQTINSVDKTKLINIDFTRCIWGDPHPLLALIIQIKKWEDEKCQLRFTLPSAADKAFIVYLVQEGFLHQLLKSWPKNDNITVVTDAQNNEFNYVEYTRAISESKEKLIFARQTCIPAQIRQTNYQTADLVDLLIKEAKQRGLEKALVSDSNIPHTSNSQFITQELRQALIELIENAKQQAYPGDSSG